MTPDEFSKKWQLTRSQMAILLGCSQQTVKQWSTGHKTPGPSVQARLDEIDTIFTGWQYQDEKIPHVRAIFDERS